MVAARVETFVVPITVIYRTIQEIVLLAALDTTDRHDYFSVDAIRLEIGIKQQKFLSYKQVRDALYRLRTVQNVSIEHVGRGKYRWLVL